MLGPDRSGWRNLCWCWCLLHLSDILVNVQVFRFLGFFDLKFPSYVVWTLSLSLSQLVCLNVFQPLIIRIRYAWHDNIRTRPQRFKLTSKIQMKLNKQYSLHSVVEEFQEGSMTGLVSAGFQIPGPCRWHTSWVEADRAIRLAAMATRAKSQHLT